MHNYVGVKLRKGRGFGHGLLAAGDLKIFSGKRYESQKASSFSDVCTARFVWAMSNGDRVVLALGGAGTVGSGIVKALLDRGKINSHITFMCSITY